MRVLVTGASGLIGRSLVGSLQTQGHDVLRAIRRGSAAPGELFWDPEHGEIDKTRLQGVHAVVHLAGESIGRKRWTQGNRGKFLRSRVLGTRLISEAISGLNPLPSVLVTASATGFYGDRGDEVLTEDSKPGVGIRADICRDWEAATSLAEVAGVRVVKLRSSFVLSSAGGILPYLLLPARFGFSIRVGPGSQYWSWISIDDEVRAILYALERREVAGPINLTSPNPVRQVQFAESLRSVLKRGRVVPVPSGVIKAVLGPKMACEVVLSSQRVFPKRLIDLGFKFSAEHLTKALGITSRA